MPTKHLAEHTPTVGASTDELIAHLKAAMHDAEALIKASANQGGEAMAAVRSKAEASIAIAQGKIADIDAALRARGRVLAEASDTYVHENPWQALGIAAGLGLIIGFLARRR